MNYQRWNIFNINKVRTEFNNTGLLCNGNQQSESLAREPSFEYPAGSGFSWGTGIGVMLGAPINQDPGVIGGYPDPQNNYSAFAMQLLMKARQRIGMKNIFSIPGIC